VEREDPMTLLENDLREITADLIEENHQLKQEVQLWKGLYEETTTKIRQLERVCEALEIKFEELVTR
jgi:DNA-binding Xre family transcriptional regulator